MTHGSDNCCCSPPGPTGGTCCGIQPDTEAGVGWPAFIQINASIAVPIPEGALCSSSPTMSRLWTAEQCGLPTLGGAYRQASAGYDYYGNWVGPGFECVNCWGGPLGSGYNGFSEWGAYCASMGENEANCAIVRGKIETNSCSIPLCGPGCEGEQSLQNVCCAPGTETNCAKGGCPPTTYGQADGCKTIVPDTSRQYPLLGDCRVPNPNWDPNDPESPPSILASPNQHTGWDGIICMDLEAPSSDPTLWDRAWQEECYNKLAVAGSNPPVMVGSYGTCHYPPSEESGGSIFVDTVTIDIQDNSPLWNPKDPNTLDFFSRTGATATFVISRGRTGDSIDYCGPNQTNCPMNYIWLFSVLNQGYRCQMTRPIGPDGIGCGAECLCPSSGQSGDQGFGPFGQFLGSAQIPGSGSSLYTPRVPNQNCKCQSGLIEISILERGERRSSRQLIEDHYYAIVDIGNEITGFTDFRCYGAIVNQVGHVFKARNVCDEPGLPQCKTTIPGSPCHPDSLKYGNAVEVTRLMFWVEGRGFSNTLTRRFADNFRDGTFRYSGNVTWDGITDVPVDVEDIIPGVSYQVKTLGDTNWPPLGAPKIGGRPVKVGQCFVAIAGGTGTGIVSVNGVERRKGDTSATIRDGEPDYSISDYVIEDKFISWFGGTQFIPAAQTMLPPWKGDPTDPSMPFLECNGEIDCATSCIPALYNLYNFVATGSGPISKPETVYAQPIFYSRLVSVWYLSNSCVDSGSAGELFGQPDQGGCKQVEVTKGGWVTTPGGVDYTGCHCKCSCDPCTESTAIPCPFFVADCDILCPAWGPTSKCVDSGMFQGGGGFYCGQSRISKWIAVKPGVDGAAMIEVWKDESGATYAFDNPPRPGKCIRMDISGA